MREVSHLSVFASWKKIKINLQGTERLCLNEYEKSKSAAVHEEMGSGQVNCWVNCFILLINAKDLGERELDSLTPYRF